MGSACSGAPAFPPSLFSSARSRIVAAVVVVHPVGVAIAVHARTPVHIAARRCVLLKLDKKWSQVLKKKFPIVIAENVPPGEIFGGTKRRKEDLPLTPLKTPFSSPKGIPPSLYVPQIPRYKIFSLN